MIGYCCTFNYALQTSGRGDGYVFTIRFAMRFHACRLQFERKDEAESEKQHLSTFRRLRNGPHGPRALGRPRLLLPPPGNLRSKSIHVLPIRLPGHVQRRTFRNFGVPEQGSLHEDRSVSSLRRRCPGKLQRRSGKAGTLTVLQAQLAYCFSSRGSAYSIRTSTTTRNRATCSTTPGTASATASRSAR